jgi:hypothetical protein
VERECGSDSGGLGSYPEVGFVNIIMILLSPVIFWPPTYMYQLLEEKTLLHCSVDLRFLSCLFLVCVGKVRPRTGSECPEGEYIYSFTLSLTSALDGDGWLKDTPDRFTPGKEAQYPFCRRLGGPQVRSGRVWKISPSRGFDPWAVQPVPSLYTDRLLPVEGSSGVHWVGELVDSEPVCGLRGGKSHLLWGIEPQSSSQYLF